LIVSAGHGIGSSTKIRKGPPKGRKNGECTMILCCGEALIDFLPVKTTDGLDAYRPVVGGSPFNAACGIGRLGGAIGMHTGISTDLFGEMLSAGLAFSNVSDRYVYSDDRQTTLAFVSLGKDEPQYAFYDEATSSRMFVPSSVRPIGAEVTMLQFGSVSLIGDPGGANLEALFHSNKGHRVLGIDPNCRPTLVKDKPAYAKRINGMLDAADIIKISKADLEWLIDGVDAEAWAKARLAKGATLVALTDGERGATGYGHGFTIVQPVIHQPHFVDAVGAGDAFTSGLLHALQQAGCLTLPGLKTINEPVAAAALNLGARVASIVCGRAGSNPPWLKEL
jgi:fructokinase